MTKPVEHTKPLEQCYLVAITDLRVADNVTASLHGLTSRCSRWPWSRDGEVSMGFSDVFAGG